MHELVDSSTFRSALNDLLKEEKAATQLLASLASKRRNLPATKVSNPSTFLFTAPDGRKVSLVDLFAGHQQLILYQFMLFDSDEEGCYCVGCSFIMDHVPPLCHLNSRDTTFVAIAPAHIHRINAYRERMGWRFPFYSCKDTFVSAGEDVTWKDFGLAVLGRNGEDVLHTYGTSKRGVELMLTTYALLDMTPLGRQEVGNGIVDFKLHDKY